MAATKRLTTSVAHPTATHVDVRGFDLAAEIIGSPRRRSTSSFC